MLNDVPSPDPLAALARDFVADFADRGPDFLASHLPERFVVGTPDGANVVERDRFVQAALQRADLVAGRGLPSPVLVDIHATALGEAYLLATAHWRLPLPGRPELDLVEDFLIDRTGPAWTCLAYLLRQDLPSLIRDAPAPEAAMAD